MKKLFKRRRGSTSITAIGVCAVIVLFCLFFLELQNMFDYQYAIEVRAQRAINSTVEYCMDDQWRADGFNVMDVSKAKTELFKTLAEDLNLSSVSASGGTCYGPDGKVLYKVKYGTPTYMDGMRGSTTGIRMDITVTMPSVLGSKFGTEKYEWTNTFESTNFRVDDDQRAGLW